MLVSILGMVVIMVGGGGEGIGECVQRVFAVYLRKK